jgi:putative autoinducer-2 (AI-2) aldolase
MKSILDYNFEGEGRGLQNRLAQMFDPKSGRTVMLAVDHGYFQGVAKGLEDIRKTVEPLLPYCDALSPTIGGLRTLDPWSRVPIILRATGGNSLERREELDDEIVTVSIDEVLRANAIGFTASVYVGLQRQRQTMENLVSLINEASTYGLIAIGITAVGDKLKELFKSEKGKQSQYIRDASRILAENGAHLIKTYYCDGFEEVVESCLAPIVIAGGTLRPTKEALKFTYDAIRAGAVGVDMGRNIFQSESPVAMIQAIRAIVHDGYTSAKAYELYEKLSKKTAVKKE